MPPITNSIHPKTRAEWRAWLKKNHQKEKLIWILHHKRHTGHPAVSHRESLEEAICFGWVDTIIKSIDENTFARCFVRRNEKGRWSNNTLSYARDMIKQKKMSAAGLKAYNAGLQRPSLDADIPKNPEPQKELLEALKRKNALDKFNNLAPSYKRYYLRWIARAKQAETKKKRIELVVQRILENKKPAD